MYAVGRDNQDMALSEYAHAYEAIRERPGLPQEMIDRIFSPRVPIPLPVFLRSPLP